MLTPSDQLLGAAGCDHSNDSLIVFDPRAASSVAPPKTPISRSGEIRKRSRVWHRDDNMHAFIKRVSTGSRHQSTQHQLTCPRLCCISHAVNKVRDPRLRNYWGAIIFTALTGDKYPPDQDDRAELARVYCRDYPIQQVATKRELLFRILQFTCEHRRFYLTKSDGDVRLQ